MGRARGYILVFLVAMWATMPALASLCPKQLPPCCRGMREMCCMSSNSPTANLCCPMQMQEAAASPAAVVNAGDHAWHAMPLAMVAHEPAQAMPQGAAAVVEAASSPPVPLSRSYAILRI